MSSPPNAATRRLNSPSGTLSVPLNIMCSKAWLRPVLPSCSSTLPTLYHNRTAATGARVSSLISTFIPLGSVENSVSACTDDKPANSNNPA